MTPLVNRLARQVIEENQIDHWNFIGLSESSMFARLSFGVRHADSVVLSCVEVAVKSLPSTGLRQLLKHAPEMITCKWSERAIVFKEHDPNDFAVALVMHEIWKLTKNTVPIH